MKTQMRTWQEQNDTQWEKLRFVLAIGRDAPLIWISSDSYHHLRTLYEQLTTEYKQYTHCRIDLGEYAGPSLTQFIQSQIPKGDDAYMLHLFGIEKHLGIGTDASPTSRIFETINFERERLFRDIPHPLLFWSESYSQLRTQLLAPDFWEWMTYKFHFEAPLSPASEGVFITGLEPPAPGEDRDALYHRIARLRHLLQSVEEDPKANPHERNTLWLGLAEAYFTLQEYQDALHWANQIINRKETASPAQYVEALDKAAQVRRLQGDYEMASQYWKEALTALRQVGNYKKEGAILNNLATVSYAKGDYGKALRYMEQSLAIRQHSHDRQGEGVTLNNIGEVHRAKGDYETALRYLEKSLSLSKAIPDRQGEETALNNISQIYKIKGDYDRALRYLEQARAIQQQIGDRQGESVTLNNIGQIHKVRGDYDRALQYLEQSLDITKQIGDIASKAITLQNMGILFFEQARYEEAIPLLIQSHQILQSIGSPNVQHPAGYLQTIRERIGEARFQKAAAKIEAK